MCTSKRAGFTLIELLVVISIIALLVSILLPALSSARQAGVQVQCLSNIRQVGMGVHMYVNDHEEYFPPGLWYDAGGWYTSFAAEASRYMGIGEGTPHTNQYGVTNSTLMIENPTNFSDGTWRNSLWFCPAKGMQNKWQGGSAGFSYGAYGANAVLMPGWDTTYFYWKNFGVKSLIRLNDTSKVPAPAQVIQNMDNHGVGGFYSSYLWLTDNVNTSVKFRHFGTIDTDETTYTPPDTGTSSMLFVDGHAAGIREGQILRGQGVSNWILP